jgi:hypothetical protein
VSGRVLPQCRVLSNAFGEQMPCTCCTGAILHGPERGMCCRLLKKNTCAVSTTAACPPARLLTSASALAGWGARQLRAACWRGPCCWQQACWLPLFSGWQQALPLPRWAGPRRELLLPLVPLAGRQQVLPLLRLAGRQWALLLPQCYQQAWVLLRVRCSGTCSRESMSVQGSDF